MSYSTETLINGALLKQARKTSALWGATQSSAAEIDLFDFSFQNATLVQAAQDLVERARNGRRARVAFVNAHVINHAATDAAYARIIAGADLAYADGSGMALAAKLAGQGFIDNVNGTDLFPLLCKSAANAGVTLYLLGGKPGVIERTVETVQKLGYGQAIAGYSHGYFKRSKDDARRVIEEINASGASILLVGMGVPIQDIWIANNFAALKTPVVAGVGGLFDFFAGGVSRAPTFLRSFGLEWVWRLLQEPSRMWKRYLVGNLVFLARAAQFAMQRRLAAKASPSFDRRFARFYAALARGAALKGAPAMKRTIDVLGSLAALALFAPVCLMAAAAIKLDSPGPIFFTQKRVGQNGILFTMFKFRSMHLGAEKLHVELQGETISRRHIRFKHTNDPRVTRVGRFIRKYSIDELPQFLNVLMGEMSLVGPRPALLSEVRNYAVADRDRLLVKPGITCTWHVAGRANVDFVDQVKLDRAYISRRSLWLDLSLLLRTPATVLFGKGAY